MDIMLHVCRLSGLNQKEEVENALKRISKFSKDDFLRLYKKCGKILNRLYRSRKIGSDVLIE